MHSFFEYSNFTFSNFGNSNVKKLNFEAYSNWAQDILYRVVKYTFHFCLPFWFENPWRSGDQRGLVSYDHGRSSCHFFVRAMKDSRYACYCCTIHRDDLAFHYQQLGEDCRADGTSSCCFQEISDDDLLDRLEAERVNLLRQWPPLWSSFYNESTICLGASDGLEDSTTDQKHIEFESRNRDE
jgi:hypothetical protein